MKHVLIVDDESEIASLIAEALDGYELTTAENGAQALLRTARAATIDLVITDFSMPYMSGAELVSRVRANHPEAKMLLITGFPEFLDMKAVGKDACLVKPFAMSSLRRTVEGLIGTP